MRDRGSVVIIEDNSVLLIRREKSGEVYYVFPGGGIETGETPEDAAIREALEELNVHVTLLGLIDVIRNDGKQYFYRAEITEGIIGTGEGAEFMDPSRGSYEPVFVPLHSLTEISVYPKKLAEKIHIMGG